MAATSATEPADPARTGDGPAGTEPEDTLRARVTRLFPRGAHPDDETWHRRHAALTWVLVLHVPGLAMFGVLAGRGPGVVALATFPVLFCLGLGAIATRRRTIALFTVTGLAYCSVALAALSGGMIETHAHALVMLGFVALYQDWVPFLWNLLVASVAPLATSVAGAAVLFGDELRPEQPWPWTFAHALAVAIGCVGVALVWRVAEDEQRRRIELDARLAEARELRTTSELLVSLARRNQGMIYRQLELLNQLEEKEQDADALADLFVLDHLAIRIRRNAETLLVLSGEEPTRVWNRPIRLVDVVRAAIGETEELAKVSFTVDERPALLGDAVTDVTHLLAELIENASRFSAPGTRVTIRSTPDVRNPGATVLTIEDWGVGMRTDELEGANAVLETPEGVDGEAARRLGLQVVGRLARRHGIQVSLATTSGHGVTSVVTLPSPLFAAPPRHVAQATPVPRDLAAVRAAVADAVAVREAVVRDVSADDTGALPIRRPRRPEPAPPEPVTPEPVEPMAPAPAPAAAMPAPVAPARTAITARAMRGGPTWGGWWESPEREPGEEKPAAAPRVIVLPPDPLPDGGSREPATAGAAGAAGRFARRSPQTHLAPELRRAARAGE